MFPRCNMQLDYSKIFSNTFKYNDAESQEALLKYAKAQFNLIDAVKYEGVMTNKKTQNYVLTFKTDGIFYSPSKSGDAFKNYLETLDSESRENVDTSHVLILDTFENTEVPQLKPTAYPIRWSPNNKVKAGGSWVLGCRKVSPKGSDQEVSSPDQPSSGEKKKTPPTPEAEPAPKRMFLPKQKAPAADEAPAVVEASVAVEAPAAAEAPAVVDLCVQNGALTDAVVEAKLAYKRLLRELCEEGAWVTMYERKGAEEMIPIDKLLDAC